MSGAMPASFFILSSGQSGCSCFRISAASSCFSAVGPVVPTCFASVRNSLAKARCFCISIAVLAACCVTVRSLPLFVAFIGSSTGRVRGPLGACTFAGGTASPGTPPACAVAAAVGLIGGGGVVGAVGVTGGVIGAVVVTGAVGVTGGEDGAVGEAGAAAGARAAICCATAATSA